MAVKTTRTATEEQLPTREEAEAAAALDALERMGYTTGGVILNKKFK